MVHRSTSLKKYYEVLFTIKFISAPYCFLSLRSKCLDYFTFNRSGRRDPYIGHAYLCQTDVGAAGYPTQTVF